MLMVSAAAVPVSAAERPRFAIAAQPMDQAIVAFGSQSGTTVGIVGSVAGLTARAVKGRMTPYAAIRRMIAGTGLAVEPIDAASFRLFRPPSTPRRDVAASMTIAPPVIAEIVVTASKRDTPVADYAGAVALLDANEGKFSRSGARGTEALVDSIASLSSTNLGPGRNKLMIRGVADSSFTGPSQATVGQYLGEVRLNYSAPDPDLNLYDMARVEVLAGPQGTLYGAGSLGGIVRLIPNEPDLDDIGASASAGLSVPRSGDAGHDLQAMMNLPVADGRVGLRAVGYRSDSGGYIDDIGRDRDDVNRSNTTGARVVLRIEPGAGWTIDLGGLIQSTNNDDGQYADRTLGRYRHASRLAEPFDNDYGLAQLVVSRHANGLSLVSATGIVAHDLDERFDATLSGTPARAYDQQNHIRLIANETRLSRRTADGTGWLLGATVISNGERVTRFLGPPGAQLQIAGVRNSFTGGALYGEATLALARRFQLTAGGRLAYGRLTGEVLGLGGRGNEPSRTEISLLPSVALSWRPVDGVTAYARYEEGYRGGGLSVTAVNGRAAAQRYLGDSIATYEAGARFGNPEQGRWSGSIAVTFANWEHIQADLVDLDGLPFTANIGDGRTRGIEAQIGWRPLPGLAIDGEIFVNDSDLSDPAPGLGVARHAELPDVAKLGGRLAARYTVPIRGSIALAIDASLRYVGHSRLGVGNGLDLLQGDYTDTGLGARIGDDHIGLSIDATNLLDSYGNRFTLGNPFTVRSGTQLTPQRPRTIRIGIDGRF